VAKSFEEHGHEMVCHCSVTERI